MVSIDRETIVFDIVMTDCGPKRIEAMAAIRRFHPELTLAGVQSLIATLPAVVLTKIDLDTIGAVLARGALQSRGNWLPKVSRCAPARWWMRR